MEIYMYISSFVTLVATSCRFRIVFRNLFDLWSLIFKVECPNLKHI